MKTTNPSDPLDSKIDALLTSQPLRPSKDFTDRVLIATDELATGPKTLRRICLWQRPALLIAALLVAAFTLAHLILTRPAEQVAPTLTTIELQEIFMLEEGLTGLTQVQYEDLNDTQLLNTINLLTFENQS
jgi:hypothetical protein